MVTQCVHKRTASWFRSGKPPDGWPRCGFFRRDGGRWASRRSAWRPGLGLFVFHISRAASYLSDAPETCMNCHVMTTQYVTWQHSSHANVATCNDCHVPHTSLAAQYGFKAKDGLWHATVFTMRWEPQAIRLSAGAVPVVENNCRRCHAAGDRGRCAGRASAGRPALLGLSPRDAARLGPQPVGHARRVSAAIAAGARAKPAADHWRKTETIRQQRMDQDKHERTFQQMMRARIMLPVFIRASFRSQPLTAQRTGASMNDDSPMHVRRPPGGVGL